MKRLKERHRERILEYVGGEPEVNLFFIGDIENFGVDSEAVNIYVNEVNGAWDCLVLRYLSDYVVYSRNPAYDAGTVASFLKAQEAGMISGKAEIIARLQEYFPERQLRTMIMTKCERVLADYEVPDGTEVRRLTADDAEALADLMLLIEEFKHSYRDRESSVIKLRTSLARGSTAYGLFKDGALVATAQAGAGNAQSAMVVGVATRPGARGLGYASAVVSSVCRASFDEGKKYLCLFYDNPQAGRIYNRIGFLPIGEYALFS